MFEHRKPRYFNTEGEARDAFIHDVNQHRDFIQKAYDIYGEELCKMAGANYKQVGTNVMSHDLSKLTDRVEAEGIMAYYYRYEKDNLGVDCPRRNYLYQKSMLAHYHTNACHPEYWIQCGDIGNDNIALEMDLDAVVEMILDWIAIGYEEDCPYTADEYWAGCRGAKLMHESTVNLTDRLIYRYEELHSEIRE